jgi:hypothetical protein
MVSGMTGTWPATSRARLRAGRSICGFTTSFTDEELWAYLESLDVSVLPYRFGTHSGWLEACHDLGTTVLAPTCGYFREQRPCLSYRHDESGFDVRSLAEAVLYAYEHRPHWQARPGDRLRERLEVAAEHRRLYERVLG